MSLEGRNLAKVAGKLIQFPTMYKNWETFCKELEAPPELTEQYTRREISLFRLFRNSLESWHTKVPMATVKDLCLVLRKVYVFKAVSKELKKFWKGTDLWYLKSSSQDFDQEVKNLSDLQIKEAALTSPSPDWMSEIESSWLITETEWAVHLARMERYLNEANHHNHTFILLEGSQTGDNKMPGHTYLMDFVQRKSKKDGQDHAGKIRLVNFEGGRNTLFKPQWMKKIGNGLEEISYLSTRLSNTVGQKLIENVELDFNHPPKYYFVGKESAPGIGDSKESHNCYSWATCQLGLALPDWKLPAESDQIWESVKKKERRASTGKSGSSKIKK